MRTLAAHVFRHGQEVTAVIESATGARFVHDQLELRGWDVAIGDAVKFTGLTPLAAKTDKIDARVLADLARRDLVRACAVVGTGSWAVANSLRPTPSMNRRPRWSP